MQLTVIHDRDASLVVDQSWECENTNFVGQFHVIRLHELDSMLVGVIVDVLQLLQNIGAGFALVII